MQAPLAADQPFIISMLVRHLKTGGGSSSAGSGPVVPCFTDGSFAVPQPVVGIKRGSRWFIDGNGNGVWDGSDQCDIESGDFGDPSDIPTPLASMIGTARAGSGNSLVWNFDADHSWNWSGSTSDQTLAVFGDGTMRPFSDASSGRIGAQNGASVYLDKSGDRTWSGAPADIDAPGYLPSAAWQFVGWYSVTQ
jgi:hypothetical protein